MAVTLFAPDEFDVSHAGVGYLVPNMQIKILKDDGQMAGYDEEGEALIRGPNAFKGYYRNPEASRKILEGGWLKTGDIVTMDKGGLLKIVDRKKELIKVKGFQVAPCEIEGVLLEHEHVIDCAVVRVIRDGREHPRAFIVRSDNKITDIHSNNLLVALTDSILSTVEDNELHRPSARKFVDETVIHVSQYMLGGAGALTICDLGQARIGQARIGKVHRGNAMPLPYRAPEVILGMTWGNSVDVWSVGLLAWDLLHKHGIFRVYEKSEELNDAYHLAAITALLGPPPDVFLRRSDKTRKYWDAEGKWHGPVPLPSEGGLQSLETNLSGEDRDRFIEFMGGLLTWLPEDRLSSAEDTFTPG
nr:hypothetical protein FVER53263_06598 [Fusarium verticillioides]